MQGRTKKIPGRRGRERGEKVFLLLFSDEEGFNARGLRGKRASKRDNLDLK